ncbi:MAG TPA: hypothetical protein VGG28_35135 [Kofleriaceae bacterium]
MRGVITLIAIVAFGCSSHGSPGAGSAAVIGSAAGSAIAVIPADAAPIDAAVQLGQTCNVSPPGVHCTLAPSGGAWRRSSCWRAIVAIEDHVAATVRFATTQQACTGELAAGSHDDVALALKDDLGSACAHDGACEIELVDAGSAAAETTTWRAFLLDQLTRERSEREDHEPATFDPDALLKKLAEVTASDDWQRPHDEVTREVYSAGAMALPQNPVYTKGQLRCALAASTAADFRSCFEQDLPIDAGVVDLQDAGSD